MQSRDTAWQACTITALDDNLHKGGREAAMFPQFLA
jgi:hypothetical protein